jgi:hypothetical protein
MEKTFSVSIRLRRVITESAHVSVTITPDLMRSDPNNPGYGSLDGEKILLAAVEQGGQPSTKWVPDEANLITPHPIQTAPDAVERQTK